MRAIADIVTDIHQGERPRNAHGAGGFARQPGFATATSPMSLLGHEPTSRQRFSEHYLAFAKGFATARACSMKSCATGLSVRFFNVMIPTQAYDS